MMIAEMKPTPSPAMTRPTHMRAMPVEAVWQMQPMAKMKQPPMIVKRRPIKSAISPAMIAPKKVPADKIEVVRDFCQEARENAFFTASLASGPGFGMPVYRVMKYGMP